MPIEVTIATPTRLLLHRKNVTFVLIPGVRGNMGVYPHSTQILAGLRSGPLRVDSPEGSEFVAIHGGLAEILPDQVNIITSVAELPHEIDVRRAEEALRRAEERLQNRAEDIDFARAEAALDRALTRLRITSDEKQEKE